MKSDKFSLVEWFIRLPASFAKLIFYSAYAYYEQLFFIVLVFSLMVGMGFWYVNGIISKQVDTNAQATLNSAHYRVQSLFYEMEISLNNLSRAVEHMVDLNLDQKTIRDFVSETADRITNDDNKLAYSGVFGEVRGERLDGTHWDPPASYDYKHREWYLKAVELQGGIYYSQPYFSYFSHKLTVTLSKELRKGGGTGDFCGVMSIDFDVEKMAEFVGALRTSGEGYVLLIDPYLNVIAHRDHDLLGKKIASISDGGKKVEKLLLEKKELQKVRYLDVSEKKNISYFQPMDNGWYVGSVTPVETFDKESHSIGFFLLVSGFVFMVSLCLILSHLHKEKTFADSRSKSKSSFLAKMSHEIRTPMNSIMGMSELILRDRKKLSPKTVEYALIIKQSSINLLAIINDILDLSKIESGKLEIINVQYTLSALLNDVLNIIRAKVRESSLQFVVFVDSHLPEQLFGDVTHVRQVLLNLLNNAVKYTHEGSVSLEITGEKKKEKKTVFLSFKVSDTGIGIRDEDKSRLFSDFVQINSSLNLNIEGTGLGLVITQELLQKMGGSISVESEYGVGSTFTALLPQTYEDSTAFAGVKEPEKHRVLVYEPRYSYERSLVRSFENLGVKYLTVSSISAFHDILRSPHEYTYIFLASFLYADVKKTLEVQAAGIQTALLFEDLEQAQVSHVWSVTLPVHSLSIANLLNNIHDDGYADSGIKTHFKAPAARILIVDDNRANLMVAQGLMEPYEMQIDCVQSGHEAIRLIQENRYDLIFMDHMMPEMDGIETSSKIRHLNRNFPGRRFAEVPIIALTANAVVGMKEVFLQNGINDYLPKPIELTKLHNILAAWLPKKKIEIILDGGGKFQREKEEISIFISGINTEIGLIQTGGTLEGYLRILVTLCSDMETKLDSMRAALDHGDIKLYKTYVHGFKSVLATVGALPISATAAALEDAANRNDWNYIVGNNDSFVQELMVIYQSIMTFLKSRESLNINNAPQEDDMNLLKSELGRLKTAVKEMKAKTIDEILDGLFAKHWSSHVHDKLEEISQNLLIFEWDQAVILIDQLC